MNYCNTALLNRKIIEFMKKRKKEKKKGRKKRKGERKTKRKTERNKAGYTATSCGRVGRSGNARFYTFRLVLKNKQNDGPTKKER